MKNDGAAYAPFVYKIHSGSVLDSVVNGRRVN